jgi:hypothetical protein
MPRTRRQTQAQKRSLPEEFYPEFSRRLADVVDRLRYAAASKAIRTRVFDDGPTFVPPGKATLNTAERLTDNDLKALLVHTNAAAHTRALCLRLWCKITGKGLALSRGRGASRSLTSGRCRSHQPRNTSGKRSTRTQQCPLSAFSTPLSSRRCF